jgi:cytochrome c556
LSNQNPSKSKTQLSLKSTTRKSVLKPMHKKLKVLSQLKKRKIPLLKAKLKREEVDVEEVVTEVNTEVEVNTEAEVTTIEREVNSEQRELKVNSEEEEVEEEVNTEEEVNIEAEVATEEEKVNSEEEEEVSTEVEVNIEVEATEVATGEVQMVKTTKASSLLPQMANRRVPEAPTEEEVATEESIEVEVEEVVKVIEEVKLRTLRSQSPRSQLRLQLQLKRSELFKLSERSD